MTIHLPKYPNVDTWPSVEALLDDFGLEFNAIDNSQLIWVERTRTGNDCPYNKAHIVYVDPTGILLEIRAEAHSSSFFQGLWKPDGTTVSALLSKPVIDPSLRIILELEFGLLLDMPSAVWVVCANGPGGNAGHGIRFVKSFETEKEVDSFCEASNNWLICRGLHIDNRPSGYLPPSIEPPFFDPELKHVPIEGVYYNRFVWLDPLNYRSTHWVCEMEKANEQRESIRKTDEN